LHLQLFFLTFVRCCALCVDAHYEKLNTMEELKIWLEGYINYTEKKIEKMKTIVPDHRNIRRFEGEVSMAKQTVVKIEQLLQKN
jgi:hypothetical protein